MNIGLVTVAYNGYEKFIPQWLEAVASLKTKPRRVTIVVGRIDESILERLSTEAKSLNPTIISADAPYNIGQMMNIAIEATQTDWIMSYGVDDVVLPDAIDHFKEHEETADFICIGWIVKDGDKPDRHKTSPTPLEMAQVPRGMGRRDILSCSPFRRSLWEKSPFPSSDYHTYPFLAQAVENGAVFAKVEAPCVIYLRRDDSHSRTILVQEAEKRIALDLQRDMDRRITNYYRRSQMDIGIVTIAYNGYGRFLPQWCKFISEMSKQPTAATAVLGKDHGLTPEQQSECLRYVPYLKIVEAPKARQLMGVLRNVAVKHTHTEWVQFLSVDDMILPFAIEEYEQFERDADYICIQWLTRGLGRREQLHISPLPEAMAARGGKGFVIAHSPFRRWLWKKAPYEKHDYPNQPFLASCVTNGARFIQTERPCTVYLRRPDSHARTVLRGRNADIQERKQARHHKKRMEDTISEYYSS